MEFSLKNLDKEVRRAWSHALFTALNRDAKEVTVEDALVGLHRVYGMLMLEYFVAPSPVLALIEQIEKGANVHDFSFSKLLEQDKGREGASAREYSFTSLPVSANLKNVLAAADAGAKVHGHPWVGLGDVMHALAGNSEVGVLFRKNGIEFQGDLKIADAEATTYENAGALPVEELMRLCEKWKQASTRVMCDFVSGAGTVQTSLGALFHVIGRVGLVTHSHAQVRIDAESADESTCLLDLRGSSIRLEAFDQLPGDARTETQGLMRIEVRLATGDRCVISPVPSFPYRTERGTTSPE